MNQLDHYQRLGVARDATTEQIKKAFKAHASRLHPDRAGNQSAAEMAAVNQAYEVLSDPVRRAHYDLTGNDRPPHNEQLACEHVVKRILQWIEQGAQGDAMRFVRSSLQQEQSRLQADLSKGEALHKVLARTVQRVQRKDGRAQDMVRMMLENHLTLLGQSIENARLGVAAVQRALEVAGSYDTRDPNVLSQSPIFNPFVNQA